VEVAVEGRSDASVGEKTKHLLEDLLVILKHAAVPGVREDA